MAESNGATGVVSREIIYLGTLPIAQIRTVTGGATSLYWFHTDHQGTPIAMTDSTGLRVWGRSQEPFGENNASYNPVGVFTTTRFDGQFLDSLTGLHYNLMRDYDPSTGRYITADPIGLNGGRNRYGYALGNPTTLTDPRGEFAIALVIPIIGFALTSIAFLDAWHKSGTGDAIEKTLYALGDDLSSLGANVRDMIGDSMINTEMGQSIYDYIFNQEENAGGQSTAGEGSVASGQICKPKDPHITPDRRKHVLEGDEKGGGGGHRHGTGKPDKTEFPESWTDDDIIDSIIDVAKNPSSSSVQGNKRIKSKGNRNGVDIEVISNPDGGIVTGYPTNTPRNPK